MSIVLIRHGKTAGNLNHTYIGCKTDEPLCDAGIRELLASAYPPVDRVYTSPMRRCVETAQILYPGISPVIVPAFKECDFGDFEEKNYEALCNNAAYLEWMASGGELPFPNGESRESFSKRCLAAFESLSDTLWSVPSALIVHGGTIMAIMENYARPKGSYYDFMVPNGSGYVLEPDGTYQRIPANQGL